MKTRNATYRHQGGAALIEAVLALPLFLLILMGLGQQFAIVLSQLEHQAIATQITLGPQERAIYFNSTDATFAMLSNNASSTPTLNAFMAQLGNHLTTVMPTGTVVHLKLAYLTGVATSGLVTGSSDPFSVTTYPTDATGECASNTYSTRLNSFVTAKLTSMAAYRHPSTEVALPVLPKLYDITTGGTQYKEYIPYLPFIFATICSTPLNLIYPQTAVSDFIIVPRRLVN